MSDSTVPTGNVTAPPMPMLHPQSGIPIDEAELIGIICEGILLGVFAALYAAAMYVLVIKRRQSGLNWPMIIAANAMAALAIAQISVDSYNVMVAFLWTPEKMRPVFLQNVTDPIFAAKHAIYFTQMLVGDWIVIYRAYVVWDNAWVALLPFLCSIGSGICAYQTIWAVGHLASTTIAAQTAWGVAVFALSLAANLMATGLLAFKIYKHDQSMNRTLNTPGRQSLLPVMRLVLESGAINAAYLIAYLAVLESGSHGLEVMAGISTPLIGIIFSIVIIRAAIHTERRSQPSMNGGVSSTRIPMPTLTRSVHTAVDFHESNGYDVEGGKVRSDF